MVIQFHQVFSSEWSYSSVRIFLKSLPKYLGNATIWYLQFHGIWDKIYLFVWHFNRLNTLRGILGRKCCRNGIAFSNLTGIAGGFLKFVNQEVV